MKRAFNSLKKYRFLLNQLISRDFKVKYKRSVLGILWSLLYPVLTMCVMAIVFSNVFKFSTPGVSYLVYLQTGLVMFNYFSEATNLSMSSVVANFSLINKVYMPKWIFPLSKCLFAGINFLLTLIPLYAVIILTGTEITWLHIFLPYAVVCLFMFTLGMGLILSTIAVFLRDIYYIYGVFIMFMMYLTPIMYDINMLDSWMVPILKLNPMYNFINFCRMIILYRQMPSIESWIACFISGFIVMVIGLILFRSKQNKFIYYV
jgi:ABC-type polysaccharide/polyol phosphate export permease